MTSALLPLALTPGCPAGVGPEVLVRALAAVADDAVPLSLPLHFFASAGLLERAAGYARVSVRREGNVVVIGRRRVLCMRHDVDDPGLQVRPGIVTAEALQCQRDGLVAAIAAAARGEVSAIVTAPVRKAALVVDGVSWPGQTELVHHTLRDDDGPPLMVFAGAPFLLGLHTVHVPLRTVSSSLTVDGVVRSLVRLAQATQRVLQVPRPKIAVLGVNPHAGEGGMFGDDEERVLAPAFAAVRASSLPIDLVGPLPADGFFADVARHRKATGVVGAQGAHAVLAMHHDQGLAPYKLLVDGDGVNITWGVRVPRTSPDHGTADALAGTGKADPSSTLAALATAVVLARGAAEARTRSL